MATTIHLVRHAQVGYLECFFPHNLLLGPNEIPRAGIISVMNTGLSLTLPLPKQAETSA